MDGYAFFYPDRPKEQQKHDTGYDMGRGVIYQTEVDCSGSKVTDHVYMELMQSLICKADELCTHVLQVQFAPFIRPSDVLVFVTA